MRIIDRASAKHYIWKDVCDGWHLLESDELSIIAEKMPPHTAEDMHYHQKSRQFFYVLRGQAVMRVGGREELIPAGSGMEIDPLEPHQMCNPGEEAIEFLVVSMPKSHGDKYLAEEY